MAKRKPKEEIVIKPSNHRFDESIENALADRIVSHEYQTAQTNAESGNADYQSYLDMLSCERTRKNYDWRSDVTTAKFTALHLQSQGLAAVQNFSTRDFVEVYIGDSKAIPAAKAEKKLVNNIFNQRELFYYQKLLRATSMKDLDGACYLRCWWEQKTERGIIGTRTEERDSDEIDIHGESLIDRQFQIPAIEFRDVPVEGDIPVIDRFNFDIISRDDIFTSSQYTYSLQEEKWVIIRYNTTITWMEERQVEMGFFNLDVLRSLKIDGRDRGSGTHTSDYGIPKGLESDKNPIKDWLIIERYGDDFAVITKDSEGNETGIEPGIDKNGNIVEGAIKLSVISAFAISGGHKVLIRFQQNPYRSARGEAYIPLIRGLCYVHPSKSDGMGDGKCSRELQIAIDDTVNISNDAVMLATMKTFICRKTSIESNDTLFIEPEHIIGLEDPNDLKPLEIQANIGEAMNQASFLGSSMEQVQATDPTSVAPVQSATAEARDEARTTTRNRFKELTFTYTMLSELYWMASQMHYQFATLQTHNEMLGDLAEDYDPSRAYAYKSITSAIETEHGKNAKTKTLLQMLQINAGIENPKTPLVINALNLKILGLQGEEYDDIKNILLDENVGGGGEVGSVAGGRTLLPTSNQQGFPQSNLEQSVRESVGA